MAEKRTEANGKGEKERYTDLNAKFQRTSVKHLPTMRERSESLPQ